MVAFVSSLALLLFLQNLEQTPVRLRLRRLGLDGRVDAQADQRAEAESSQYLERKQKRPVFSERANMVPEVGDEASGWHGRGRGGQLVHIIFVVLVERLVFWSEK